MKRLACALFLIGCGSHDAPPAPAPAEPAPPGPLPGIDLAGPIPLPEHHAGDRAGTAAPAMLDLVADRAIVPVSVPRPPLGGTVGFSFGDDHAAWVTRIPEALQLPAVAFGDGRVYVSGGFESRSFYGLDAETGKIQWASTNLEDNGPTAAIYEERRVLFNTESCTLFALDAKTGAHLWFRYLGDPTLSQIAVAEGLVFAAHPADNGHALSAFKVASGNEAWSAYVGTELLAGPVIAGDAVYASTVGGMTYRFARATGKQVWAKPLAATTAPWIAGDELFVTRRHAGVEQQVVVDAATGKVVREHEEAAGKYAGDVPSSASEPKTIWAFEGSRPVIDRGVRYVAMGGEIRASDAATGSALWQRRYASGKPDRRTLGSVALAGSEVVVATRDGKLFGLDVDTGYTLWSYDIGHRVVAEPIVARGWVYSATEDGYVVALSVGDATLDGWHMFGGNPAHDGPVIAPPQTRGPERAEPSARSARPASEPVQTPRAASL